MAWRAASFADRHGKQIRERDSTDYADSADEEKGILGIKGFDGSTQLLGPVKGTFIWKSPQSREAEPEDDIRAENYFYRAQ